MIAASIIIGRALQPIELVVGNWKSFLAAREAFARMKLMLHAAGVEPERMRLPRPEGLLTSKPSCHGPGRQGADFEGHLLQTWGRRASRASSVQVRQANRASLVFSWGLASSRRRCPPGRI